MIRGRDCAQVRPSGGCTFPLVDAIDRVVMNARLHYLGSAARIVEPVQHLAVLTCMDTRLSIRTLGLKTGDAHIIRNAGGIVTDDSLRSLVVSHYLLGTEEIMVINQPTAG